MLVALLVKLRNKDCKTTELGLLLQVLPVRIVTFVETLGSYLKTVCFLGLYFAVRALYCLVIFVPLNLAWKRS